MKFLHLKVHSTQTHLRTYRKEAWVFDNPVANKMIADFAELGQPDRIELFRGTPDHFEILRKESIRDNERVQFDENKWPNCDWVRSVVNDVARVESKTIIASNHEDDAGPKLHWRNPIQMRKELNNITRGSMKGRTLYVVPFSMGPVNSSFSITGIQLTDSRYVAESMYVMTRTGEDVISKINSGHSFVRCLHAKADLDPEKRWIVHFPDSQEIYSVGSNYGGNALLGKKCLSLRIASVLGRQRGWMAEHMLITGIHTPEGKIYYVTAAFPSACGKTNFAMIKFPQFLLDQGYRVSTLGDDIAWMYPNQEGQLMAINPENGFFGVAPGTNEKTNFYMWNAIRRDTTFTNTALTKNSEGHYEPWWEGMTDEYPDNLITWDGKVYDPKNKFTNEELKKLGVSRNNKWFPGMTVDKEGVLEKVPAAHPNSRFTTPAKNCEILSEYFNDKDGVPISAFLFGGRRAKLAPLIYEARDWEHGVYVASTMASETTAAATGAVGQVRRDPMAMLPFFGYNIGKYFEHWLNVGKNLEKKPKVFHVNWFRKDKDGKFLWPGYGDNARVIKWIIDRIEGKVSVKDSIIGYLPNAKDIDVTDLNNYSQEKIEQQLLSVDPDLLEQDLEGIDEFYAEIGEHLPAELKEQFHNVKEHIKQQKELKI
jgi:phosphoenolpyruvate carboxykinase (GTP)